MIRLFAALLLTICSATILNAQERIVLGLSQNAVSITATFTGSEILIFGAIQRESPPPVNSDLGVIIAVAGPNVPVTVRKKERVAGIWVNAESENMAIAPSFYAVATSAGIDDVLLPLEDYKHAITWRRVVRAEGQDVFATTPFTEAYNRIKTSEDSYQILENAVSLEENTLFHTTMSLPANLTEGDYKTRIFLTRDGQVVDQFDVVIPVYKVGIERWLYNLAQHYSAAYGILSLLIAVLAGWAASAAFGILLRR